MRIQTSLLLSAAVLVASIPVGAAAQQAQDVIVMRKTIELHGIELPPKTPTATPTPIPAPTPKPTPSWIAGDWTFPAATECSDAAEQTRSVVCTLPNGSAVADSECTSAKPASTTTAERYDGCSFDWTAGGFGEWDSQCSTKAKHSRTVVCQRHGGTTTALTVSDDRCTTVKPAETESAEVLTGCTYTAGFGTTEACTPDAPGSKTGTMVTAVTSCTRSDSTSVALSYCESQTKRQSCTISYEGVYGSYSACSGGKQTATLTSCTARTSDGKTSSVPVSYCTGGTPPTRSCQASCDALQVGKGISSYDPNNVRNAALVVRGTLAEQVQKAQDFCETAVGPAGYKQYYCMLMNAGSASPTVYVFYGTSATARMDVVTGYTDRYLAKCNPQ